ncbi:MAG TPA: hypothetical protein VLA96_00410 [Terriglobales bacterium]|nr:hypothetical protein [Terriglobales bacterium]
MKLLYKGLIIAALHAALVSSLGVKLLYDRHTRPRVWAQTLPYDPELPIRGRYLSMQLVVETEGFETPHLRRELFRWRWGTNERRARLEVRGNKLVAVKDDNGDRYIWFSPAPGTVLPPFEFRDCYKEPAEKMSACMTEREQAENTATVDVPLVGVLTEPVLYFIPEHAKDPSPRGMGNGELWAEVTVPKAGPPRPIQLALKKDGKWEPLELR